MCNVCQNTKALANIANRKGNKKLGASVERFELGVWERE